MNVWVLVLLAVLVLLVVLGIVVVVIRLTKPKSPDVQGFSGTPTAPAPGWYPDPNDSSVSRYFDGRAWTAETQPRG
jgi:hypothetical protein